MRDTGESPIGREALNAVRGLVPCLGGCLYRVDEIGEPGGHILSGLPPEHLHAYRDRFIRFDPFHPARFQTRSESIVTLDAFARREDVTPYVEGFLHSHDLMHEVEMFLRDAQGQILVGIALFRTETGGAFRRCEIDMLARVRPVLEVALQLAMPTHARATGPACAGDFDLTAREVDVVELVRKGLSNRNIAAALDIKLSTVKAHLYNIFAKIGVSSRTELLSHVYFHV